MFCNRCGKQIPDNSKYCLECGANVNAQDGQGDETSFGYALLSFFIPVVGLVLFIVWNKEYPKKAKSCLNGIIAGIVMWVILICCALTSVTKYTKFVNDTEWAEQIETDVGLRCLR